MSNDLLHAIYHGNYRVNDRSFKAGTEYAKVLDRITKLEDCLRAELNSEQVAVLKQLASAQQDLSDLTAVEDFVTGFRLGMRLLLEGLSEDDGTFQMISE